MTEPVLSVVDLSVRFETERGAVRAVDGVSFEIAPGEVVGLVGESGCGKSAACLALMGLLPSPAGRARAASIRLCGEEVANADASVLQALRGRRVAMIFQDPMKCLNPYLRIGEQLCEAPRRHLGLTRAEARARALELLGRVGIPAPEQRIDGYAHELSGGMRQRVMIAMALACEPDLLIADEPTTALDVSIQAQILALLEDVCAERGTSVLFITHDLGVVSGLCDRVLVMYAGQIVEEAPSEALFAAPEHPYTRALLRCIPRLDGERGARLESIDGLPPRLDDAAPRACRFAPRCADVRPACREGEPPLVETAERRQRRCVVPVEALS